jgi:hypothetical protein
VKSFHRLREPGFGSADLQNTFGVLLGQAGIASGCSCKTINFSPDDGSVEG